MALLVTLKRVFPFEIKVGKTKTLMECQRALNETLFDYCPAQAKPWWLGCGANAALRAPLHLQVGGMSNR